MLALLTGAGLAMLGATAAAEEDLPDMAFLEYLGMWEESDDEWLLFEDDSEQAAAETQERIDPVPQGEESTENDDES
ncbi:MAG: hypothetical protein R3288_05590 [Woeseiaceae bacterium]|nr:hypothetical protein [Woeseiaceae bacterium]